MQPLPRARLFAMFIQRRGIMWVPVLAPSYFLQLGMVPLPVSELAFARNIVQAVITAIKASLGYLRAVGSFLTHGMSRVKTESWLNSS
eukprot:scaffold355692_cov19-Prasinocladus_malaysianus.AAC.1